jgi:hypothetical protein
VKELQTAVTIVKGGQKMFFFSVARKNAKRRQKHFLESSKNIKVKIFDICICISKNVLLIFLINYRQTFSYAERNSLMLRQHEKADFE